MTTQKIPQPARKDQRPAKAREIAAAPQAIYQAGIDRYFVRSQSQERDPGDGSHIPYYTVAGYVPTDQPNAEELSWSCTCPDYRRRGQPCKHILAVQELRSAQEHAERFMSAMQWSETELLDYLQEMRAAAQDTDTRLLVDIALNSLRLPSAIALLRFPWHTYHPEQLFDTVDALPFFGAEPDADKVKTWDPNIREWRTSRLGITEIREWMEEHNITVGAVRLVEKDPHLQQRWHGLYEILLVKNPEVAA